MPTPDLQRAMTPNALARFLGVSPDKVRAWIAAGKLGAVNVASSRCGRPQYRVLPCHLAAWQQANAGAKPAPAPRRRRQPAEVDFFPGD